LHPVQPSRCRGAEGWGTRAALVALAALAARSLRLMRSLRSLLAQCARCALATLDALAALDVPPALGQAWARHTQVSLQRYAMRMVGGERTHGRWRTHGAQRAQRAHGERSERRAQRASSAASAASAERSERRAQRAPSAGSAERSERRAQRAQRAPSAASAGRSERRAQREPGASSAASPERSERRAPQRGAASAGRSGAQRVPGAAGRSKHNTRSGRRARQPLSPLAVQMRLRPPGATACGCACGGSRPLERKPLRAPLAAPGERIRRTTLGRTRAPGCAQAHAPLAAPTPLVVHAHPCPLRHGRHPRGEGSPAVGWVQLGAEPQGSRLPTLVDHAQPGAGQRRLVLGHRVLASAAALRPEARRAVPSRVALEEQQHRPRVARSGQPAARQAQGHHRQRGAEEEP